MNRKVAGSFIVLVLLLAPGAFATVIRCGSDYNRRTVCTFEGWGRATLSRQLSRTACIEGSTWGREGHSGVWVSNGCRADFFINREEREHRRQVVVCESDRDDRSFCQADTTHGIVLSRQLSRRECVLNRTWGYNSRGIWVSHGCRAEFLVGR